MSSESDLVERPNEGCIICANGNDLPDGERCAVCDREGSAIGLRAAVIKARGRQEPPKTPVAFVFKATDEIERLRTERDDALALAAKLNGEVETMRAVLTEQEKRWDAVHDMVLKARELVRLDIEPDNRPVGLFQSLQDALYAIRGRAALIPNHPAGEEK